VFQSILGLAGGSSFVAPPEETLFMRPCAIQALLIVGFAGFVGLPAPAAADAPDDDIQKRLKNMQKEIENLRSDNASMKGEINRLHEQVGDDWITEQRADEIRGLVADVIADADTRASLLNGGQTAGWNEHFFLASPDGRFSLQLEGQMQIRFVLNWKESPGDGTQYGFENTRTKLTFRGHVFSPDTTYLVRGNFSREQFAQSAASGTPAVSPGGTSDKGGVFQLQDAWIQQQINREWSVRLGQFKLPFTREELVSSQYQLFVERSLINISQNLGRSQGIEINYFGDLFSLSMAFSDGGHDQIGGFGTIATTVPENTPALTRLTEFAITARAQWLAAGDWNQFVDFTSPPGEQFGLMFGAAGHYQKNEFGVATFTRDEEYWYAYTVDMSIEWGGINAFASFTHHYVDNAGIGIVEVYGALVQAGVYVTPKIELIGRFEYGRLSLDTGFNFSNLYLLTVGANYYIDGHDLKVSADVGFAFSHIENIWDADIAGWQIDTPGNEPQIVGRLQVQLLF
jgi:phosphate-selective porin OprO/OprP